MKTTASRPDIASEYRALLRGVAEELKLPLVQVARQAELALIAQTDPSEILREINSTASVALELLDSYLLGLQLSQSQQALELEPVSASSTLYDVAQDLNEASRRHNVELRLEVQGTQPLVMANRKALTAALLSLGNVFVGMQNYEHKSRAIITLAAHRSRGNLAAGIYSDGPVISAAELRRAYDLHSRQTRQPLNQLSAGSAAGLFVARQILNATAADLRAIRHHRQTGIAAILKPSYQLQMV